MQCSRFLTFLPLQIIIWIIAAILTAIFFTAAGLGGFGMWGIISLIITLLWIIMFLLWLFLMYKAYKGEKFLVPIVGAIAESQVK